MTSVSVSVRKLVAFFDQLLLQADVVLNDAVVHDDDLAGAVAMRMSVLFRGAAVGGPARVADAIGAIERLQADHLFQVAQLAFGAAHLQPCHHCRQPRFRPSHTRDIPASQAVDNDRNHPLLADVTYNSAHNFLTLTSCAFVEIRAGH